MQEMVESQSDAWSYILDRLKSFYEGTLSHSESDFSNEVKENVWPTAFIKIPEKVQEFTGVPVIEQTELLGVRTGEMHLALASGTEDEFKPEEFSLHYQRSLFSSFQSLVRGTFQNQAKNMKKLPDSVRREAEEVLSMKDEILNIYKRIYSRKIDVVKTRIHGDYHLGQVLFTGKDFIILDFEGEPARSYSERRLKRSPIRDVAGMIRSFHYAAYSGLFLNNEFREEDINKLLPFAEQWYHYMSGLFLKSYLNTVKDSPFIPKQAEDLEILLQTYLLEKVIYELNYELNNRPEWVVIPLRGIKSIIKESKNQ